ncbi:H-NS family nucleoid-associated regulatory protein [Variovorax sp. J22G73]|uniref:H-NS histone family protein n=1 Tax=unclassified Variovorax TaxID=663243 RepID=UPI002579176F|nr:MULTISPECIES: H-NS family nucleoid-associated regulatory protein [unclassified Variovorax]MDM0010169.1 H-NS family nucleoid-associated regulatory protein [Variovorax sp. J22R203]MDM0102969.1 H-NS family nucleoid-associated regulatory protein [Variovorax sp. J22G73]
MAQTLAQITKQIEKLQKEADALRESELKGVVERIKAAISHYGLTPDQLGFGRTAVKSPKVVKAGASNSNKSAAPRFANNDGQVWSGRGPRPRWLREALSNGRSLEEFSTEAQQRSASAFASKQGDVAAVVAKPDTLDSMAKRAKASAKTRIANAANLSTDATVPSQGVSKVVARKAQRQAKTSPKKTVRVKKTALPKAARASVKGAPQSKSKRVKSVAPVANKGTATAGAEKSGPSATTSAGV